MSSEWLGKLNVSMVKENHIVNVVKDLRSANMEEENKNVRSARVVTQTLKSPETFAARAGINIYRNVGV